MIKILLILTGGTIGSTVVSDTIAPDAGAGSALVRLYLQQHPDIAAFEVCQPMTLLSENLCPSDWSALTKFLSEVNFTAYDGIIVTHGTDTLPYTAALLGMLFRHIPVPLVLVSSNYALGLPHSNGYANFENAVALIQDGKLPGVSVLFQDTDGKNLAYLPTRLLEADSYCDRFESFGRIPYGEIRNGSLVRFSHPINPTFSALAQSRDNPLRKTALEFRNQVWMLHPYPGLSYAAIDLSNPPTAILHGLYHSATACTKGAQTALPAFIARCHTAGVPIYLCSAKNTDAKYSTTREMEAEAVHWLPNTACAAAYAKLMIAYNQTELPPAEYAAASQYFEILP